MNDALYFMIVKMVDLNLWGGELVGEENLPEKGPAVFVANHLGSTGPIGVVCSIPVRFYTWTLSKTIDPIEAPEYLRVDFVEPELHLKPPLSLLVSKAICRISVPMLNALGCIPVYQDPVKLIRTYRLSLSLLLKGKYLLVFPEDPTQAADPECKMRPFKQGLSRLGEMYFKATGNSLNFYPVAMHEDRKVKVGLPIAYNPYNPPARERLRIIGLLESNIRQMYLQITMGDYLGVPLPH